MLKVFHGQKLPNRWTSVSGLASGGFALMLLGGLTLVGCKKPETADAAGGSQSLVAPEPPVDVKTAPVVAVSVPRKLRFTGTLRGARETDLAANVAGLVTATFAERGQIVKSGETLARVDVRGATLALEEAKVQVANSRVQQSISTADCARYEQLKQRGAVSDYEYDQITARCKVAPGNIEAAEARQRIAAKNVGDGIIRAPFAGVVNERFVEVGEYVQASTRVVSIAQIAELRAEFSVPEQNFADVKVGAPVQFRVAAYPEQVFTAKVTRISGAVRPTRDILVEAVTNNPESKLLPGMFAEVEVVTGEEQLPSLPESAVFEKNGKLNAFVVVNKSLEQRVLQAAETLDGRVPVRRGVNAGEQVVIANVAQLKNGQKVN